MTTEMASSMAGKKQLNILIIRPDKIGDVILSTPVLTSIKTAKPDWSVSLLIRPMVAELMKQHKDVDEIIELATNQKPNFGNTSNLAGKLRQQKFDVAIHLYSDFWVSLAVWRAGIPLRIGPASKLAQVFYNHTIKQYRSKRAFHEADYNLELLKPLRISPIKKSSIPYDENLPPEVEQLLTSGKKVAAIFPGMGGSARNWKPEQYAKLADALYAKGIDIILVSGPNEEPLLKELNRHTKAGYPQVSGLAIKKFAGLLKRLDVFIAPSTGPLHMATAVGTAAVGIYCPIKVCLPQRWGPIGKKDIGLLPDVPVCEECTMQRCKQYECMDKLSVDSVTTAVMERI